MPRRHIVVPTMDRHRRPAPAKELTEDEKIDGRLAMVNRLLREAMAIGRVPTDRINVTVSRLLARIRNDINGERPGPS